MHMPATIFDYTEKDRHRIIYYVMGAVFLLGAGILAANYYHVNFVFIWLAFNLFGARIPRLGAKTDITRFGIFRSGDGGLGNSLKWSEVSGVEVDREQQKIIVTGTKQGKKRPISLVIKCPNGELDEVLSLLSQKLPPTSGATLQISNSRLSTPGNVQEV